MTTTTIKKLEAQLNRTKAKWSFTSNEGLQRLYENAISRIESEINNLQS